MSERRSRLLVGLLRDAFSGDMQHPQPWLLRDAADEIERLLAPVATLNGQPCSTISAANTDDALAATRDNAEPVGYVSEETIADLRGGGSPVAAIMPEPHFTAIVPLYLGAHRSPDVEGPQNG